MFTSFVMREKKDVKEDAKFEKMARELNGLNTVSSVCKKLGIQKKTAINYIYEMKKRGFVKASRGSGKIRMYSISPARKKELGYPGLYDIINEHSPLKITSPFNHRVYEEMTVEEAIVRALETKDFMVILASLALFRHVRNWPRLYGFAKEKDVRRQVGALYDLSRKVMKAKRMDRRIENNLLAARQKDKFIVPGISAKDFPEISRKWNICVPFTKGDIKRFKE